MPAATSNKTKSPVPQTMLFPRKLHEVLEDAEREGFDNIIAWMPDGVSFKVFDSKGFVATVLPKYFATDKKKSFVRQLNLWGFERITSMPNYGAYRHSAFIRGQPDLCKTMRRTKIKGAAKKSIEGHHSRCASPVAPQSFFGMAKAVMPGRQVTVDSEDEHHSVSFSNKKTADHADHFILTCEDEPLPFCGPSSDVPSIVAFQADEVELSKSKNDFTPDEWRYVQLGMSLGAELRELFQ